MGIIFEEPITVTGIIGLPDFEAEIKKIARELGMNERAVGNILKKMK